MNMMNISFENKNALVGGSTQGLGKAIAIQLAECGANVTLMARNETELKSVMQEMNTESGQKHSYYAYLAAFLASEYASYITGTNIPIDGGLLKSFT